MKLFQVPLLPSRSIRSRKPAGRRFDRNKTFNAGLIEQARYRLKQAPFVTRGFEVHRLQARLHELDRQFLRAVNGERARLQQMKSDCMKAIASLALLPEARP